MDQFEEFFIVFGEKPKEREEFIRQLARIRYDEQLPIFIVLSLREDYFANLYEFREAIPSIFQNNANIRLKPFDNDEARRAIEEPAKSLGYKYEDKLLKSLLTDLKVGQPGIEPIKLQIVCNKLWNSKTGSDKTIPWQLYNDFGKAEKILNDHLEIALKNIPSRQHNFLVRLFEELKTPENTKRYCSYNSLVKVLSKSGKKKLIKLLKTLTDIQLLRHEKRSGEDWYEFKHDYLASEIAKWIQERKERIAKKRMRYAIGPAALLALIILGFMINSFLRYNAGFTTKDYEPQNREIVISRDFFFSEDPITTGLLEHVDVTQLRDKNILVNKYHTGYGNTEGWEKIATHLDIVSAGLFLYKLGYSKIGLDSLIQALNFPNSEVRSRATTALGNLRKADDTVINALIQALNDEASEVRDEAATALGNLRKVDYKVINALIKALYDQAPSVRYKAANALGNLRKADDKVIQALIEALNYLDYNVRWRAASALGNFGKADDTVINTLIKALYDQDSYVREEVAYALGYLRKTDDKVIQALIKALYDQDYDVREGAAYALGNLRKADDNVIQALIKALNDRYSSVRWRAASSLGNLEKADDKVINALIKALNDQDFKVRRSAAKAMENLGKTDDTAIQALFQALNDQDSSVRLQAAIALGNLRKADDTVINTLIQVLNDQDPSGIRQAARWQAATALGNLGKADDKVINTLIKVLTDQDSGVRGLAATALGNLEKADDTVINALIWAFYDQHSYVREEAANALVNLGKSDDKVIQALIKSLNDKNYYGRWRAASALVNFGKADDTAIQALFQALNDQDSYVRLQAATGLGILFKAKPNSELFHLLENKTSGYRIAAYQALARKDTLEEQIITQISLLKNDNRPWVRLTD